MLVSMDTKNINKNKLKFATSRAKRVYFRGEKSIKMLSLVGKVKIIHSSILSYTPQYYSLLLNSH